MQFTEEQQLIQDMAKSFAQEQIKPNAGEWDEKAFSRKRLWPKWVNWALWEC